MGEKPFYEIPRELLEKIYKLRNSVEELLLEEVTFNEGYPTTDKPYTSDTVVIIVLSNYRLVIYLNRENGHNLIYPKVDTYEFNEGRFKFIEKEWIEELG